MTEESEVTKSAISRRNALKAGAAVGVGAAAFAGPQIGVLGAAPAYAQTCSIAPVTVLGEDRNVSCTSNCTTVFELLPETVTVTFAGQTFDVTTEGCADSDALWVDGSPSTIDCEVKAVPVGHPAILLPSTDFCRSTGPSNCGSAGFSCSSRYQLQVTCAQAGCL